MGSCIACHQAKGAPTTCDTCHVLMSSRNQSPFEADPAALARLGIMPTRKQQPTISAKNNALRRSQAPLLATFLNAPLL
jgi:hypothetical protein